MAVSLSLTENVVLSTFAFHCCVCIFKIFLMGALTSLTRLRKGSFANKEDCKAFANDKIQPKFDDLAVERFRRNHLNDLENILPFILVGIFYVLTGPAVGQAIWHFRIFTVARILHTLAYQLPLPQPSRATFHFICLGITSSMAIQVLRATSW